MINQKRLFHVALLLLFSALIGLLYPAVKIAEQSITPLTLTMLRALLAFLVMLPVVGLVMKRSLAPLRSEWKAFALMGLMLALFFTAVFESEERISASLGALLACVLPIATFLIATLVLRWEQFTFLRLAGSLLALTGVALFIGLEQLLSSRAELWGVAIMTGGYLVYAVNLLYVRHRNLDPFVTVTGTLLFVTLFTAVIAFSREQPLALDPSGESLLATLFIGIFSTGLGYFILFYLIAEAGPVFTSTLGYIMPIFAIVGSHMLLGESLAWIQITGLALTIAGAALVNRKREQQAAA